MTALTRALVALAVVAALLYAGYRLFRSSVTLVDTGTVLTVTRGRIQVVYARGEAFRGVFMVFGGSPVSGFWSESVFAYLGGLPLADARAIRAKYPDFHMCASPGAALAKGAMVHLNLIASDSAMRDRIDGAIREHDRRLEKQGERLCVTLAGQTLRRTSYTIEGAEAVVVEGTPFTHVLLREFGVQDCKAMLEAVALR